MLGVVAAVRGFRHLRGDEEFGALHQVAARNRSPITPLEMHLGHCAADAVRSSGDHDGAHEAAMFSASVVLRSVLLGVGRPGSWVAAQEDDHDGREREPRDSVELAQRIVGVDRRNGHRDRGDADRGAEP